MQRAAEHGAAELLTVPTVPTKPCEEELPVCVVNHSSGTKNIANIADEASVIGSCTNETTTTTTNGSFAVTSTVGNSCRVSVVAAAAAAAATLCTLQRTEPTVGCTDHGKQLQPSDKDAITC